MTFDRQEPSGMGATLGYRQGLWTAEQAVMHLSLDDRHTNVAGLTHGGVYATLIDAATGYLICWNPDSALRKMGVTLSLNVSFIGAPTTAEITVTAQVKGGGRSIAFATAEVRDSADTLLARGDAVYKTRPMAPG